MLLQAGHVARVARLAVGVPRQRLPLPPVLDGELGVVVAAVEAVVPAEGDKVVAGEEGAHVGGPVRLAPLLQPDDGALRANGVH